jgi:L-iditol 2-dehydrogenase
MRSVVLSASPDGQGLKPRLVDMDLPVPGEGGMVVEMGACGLCGTDLEKMRGEYTASMPVVGHEAVGTVAALGAGVNGFAVGDRVFPHHHVPCYECHLCRAGSETMCERYRGSNLIPGGFSESFLVPSWNVSKGGVLKLPRGMDFEVASLIEPLACCIRALGKSGVAPGESVLIAGAGPVGMLHALLLKRVGAEVMLSDVSESRLAFAEKSGAGRVIDAKGDAAGEVKSETGGRGVDLAIVASGSKAAIVQGLRSIRKGGRVCLFGIPQKGSVLDYDVGDLYNSEQRIFTSYGATESDARQALDALSEGGAVYARLVTHRFPLERFDDAVRAASGGGAMKVVVTR